MHNARYYTDAFWAGLRARPFFLNNVSGTPNRRSCVLELRAEIYGTEKEDQNGCQ